MAELTKVRKSVIEKSQVLPDQAGQGGKYLGTDGTTASWQATSSGLSVGSIIPYYGTSAPSGWLALSRGAYITKAEYPALYDHLVAMKQPGGTYEITFVGDPTGDTAEITQSEMESRPLKDYVGTYFIYPNWIARVENYRETTDGVRATLVAIVGPITADYVPDFYYSLVDIQPNTVLDITSESVFLPHAENIAGHAASKWLIKAYDAIDDSDQLQAQAVIDQVNNNTNSITRLQEQIPNSVQDISNPNLLINGDFSVWQRGVSFSNPHGFTCDRWETYYVSEVWNATSDFGYHTLPTGNRSNTAIGFKAGNNVDASHPPIIRQKIEKGKFLINGNTVTFSFNFHTNLQSGVQLEVDINDNTDVKQIHATYGWSYHEVTFETVADNIDQDSTYTYSFIDISVINIDSSQQFHLADCKLEFGSIATPFIPDNPAINLAKCQRYYLRLNADASFGYVSHPYSSFNTPNMRITFPTTMRISPTVTVANWPSSLVATPTVSVSYVDGVTFSCEDPFYTQDTAFKFDAEL